MVKLVNNPIPSTSFITIPTSHAHKRDTKAAATDALAGALSGAFSKTIAAPLDRIKLLVQLRGSIVTADGNKSRQHIAKQNEGGLKSLQNVIRNEGVLSLWRGNAPTILIQGATSALNFLFLESYKANVKEWANNLSVGDVDSRTQRLFSSFVSGGLAGASTITLIYPLGFMRTRLATDVGSAAKNERLYPNGMRDVVRSVWQTDGFRGFYKGFGIALASVTLYRIVYLGGYDFLRAEMSECSVGGNAHGPSATKEAPVVQRFAAAQLVSMVASIAHYPLDSIRRRLMMEAGKSNNERLYLNAMDCFRKILREEGCRGFYRGLGVNLVRSVGAALVLVSYDEFKRVLK